MHVLEVEKRGKALNADDAEARRKDKGGKTHVLFAAPRGRSKSRPVGKDQTGEHELHTAVVLRKLTGHECW